MHTRKLILITLLVTGLMGAQAADVVIDPVQTFQRISGWGHGGEVLGGTGGAEFMLPQALGDPVNYQYLDFITDDLGLTGTRTWEVGPRIEGTGTDDGDCDDQPSVTMPIRHTRTGIAEMLPERAAEFADRLLVWQPNCNETGCRGQRSSLRLLAKASIVCVL